MWNTRAIPRLFEKSTVISESSGSIHSIKTIWNAFRASSHWEVCKVHGHERGSELSSQQAAQPGCPTVKCILHCNDSVKKTGKLKNMQAQMISTGTLNQITLSELQNQFTSVYFITKYISVHLEARPPISFGVGSGPRSRSWLFRWLRSVSLGSA